MIPTRTVVNSEDQLFDFINEQIAKFKGYSELGTEYDQPGFYDLTMALKNWAPINYSLISLGIIAKREYQKAKEDFDDFMADKYMEQRAILNPPGLSAQKYASSKEIEYAVINTYRSEYHRLSKAVDDADMKIAFIRRMQDSWERQLLVLNRLCKNVDTETTKLGSNMINV